MHLAIHRPSHRHENKDIWRESFRREQTGLEPAIRGWYWELCREYHNPSNVQQQRSLSSLTLNKWINTKVLRCSQHPSILLLQDLSSDSDTISLHWGRTRLTAQVLDFAFQKRIGATWKTVHKGRNSRSHIPANDAHFFAKCRGLLVAQGISWKKHKLSIARSSFSRGKVTDGVSPTTFYHPINRVLLHLLLQWNLHINRINVSGSVTAWDTCVYGHRNSQ